MLFNDPSFLFVFLPVALIGYLLLRHRAPMGSMIWLAVASLVFYGVSSLSFLGLFVVSLIANYGFSRVLVSAGRRRKALLAMGLAGNLALLGYFKYANFFVRTVQDLGGVSLSWQAVVLPIGISFFTFQQMAFLVDCYRADVKERSFLRYLLFIMFFPQLIAGPIVHHKEMMPQFGRRRASVQGDFLAGLTLLFIGLLKKMIVADGAALVATPIFGAAANQAPLGWAVSWLGALAYAVQIYFDFSAYSDMAIGLGRMFGIELPINFASPYKARNVAAFWRRWHITLSRFLRDYLYYPLGGNRLGAGRQALNLMMTMIFGGFWHGAGWTFLLWGFLHGVYLMIHKGWRSLSLAPRFGQMPLWPFAAWAITFVAVVVAWVPFRAAGLRPTLLLWQSMAGLHGVWSGWDKLAPDAWSLAVVCGGLGIAFVAPRAYRWLGFLRLGLASAGYPATQAEAGQRVAPWYGTWLHALGLGTALALVVMKLNDVSEFIYFQF